jgi:hypothetical protein
VEFDFSNPGIRDHVIDLFRAIKVGCHSGDTYETTEADGTPSICIPVDALDELTHIPKASQLYNYISQHPRYRAKKTEFNLERVRLTTKGVRVKCIKILKKHLWSEGDDRLQNIPAIMNPIMDIIAETKNDDEVQVYTNIEKHV